jgi:predicted ATPase/class 3 adenylate cyclase
MAELPTGTVTLLFTDIERSTQFLQRFGDRRYANVLEEHRQLLRTVFRQTGGHEVATQGDGFLIAFHSARNAVMAAVTGQRALISHAWKDGAALQVRMGLHAGEPTTVFGEYMGLDVHRSARICSAGHGGQILLSEAVKALVEARLPADTTLRDLGTHRLRDLQRPERLFQAIHPDLPEDFPPLRSLTARPNNIPLPLSSFIGREREIQEAKDVAARTRLLTLTGPGGVGKTRLALQLAADILTDFEDGVWWVELGALSDSALVAQAVAKTIGLTEAPHVSPVRMLINALFAKSTLLILDNCEHLIGACAHLAETLLRACPNLKIMTTSREPLTISGEVIYVVPPFMTPDLKLVPPLASLRNYEAVRLFIDRAAAHTPGFTLVEDNALAIAHACHRLDGIPLAIELAAARVKALPVELIVKRLDERFQILTTGTRTALPQHQTLQATMDWSHDLLSEKERVLFRRLAVFAGSFTLEAAEALCAGGAVDGKDVLDLLSQLVSKSLVIAGRTHREARYRLLETVRQYSQGKLDQLRETVSTRERHRAYFLRVAETAEPKLRGPEQAASFELLESDHDNLRSALTWAEESGDTDSTLRLCGVLWWFWYVRGYHREGRKWLEDGLENGRAAPPVLLARAHGGAGYLAIDQGDYDAALSHLEESLSMHRALGDKAGVAESLHGLGRVAWRRGDFDRAATFYEEALLLRQDLGPTPIVGLVLNSLATLTMARGDLARAASLLRESLAVNREIGNRRGMAVATGNLGTVALRLAQYVEAGPLLKEALALRSELGDKRGIVSELVELGLLRGAQRQAVRAARILGAAEALGDAIGAPLSASEYAVADYDRYVALVNADLGPEAFATAWTDGRAMTLERALEYAITEPTE